MMASSTFHEVEGDLFDRLPDPIVHLIFNKVQDAKTLCLSMSVCKRFYAIVPEVDAIFLSMKKENQQNPIKKNSNELKKSFKNVVGKVLAKPFKFLSQLLKLKSGSCHHDDDDYSYHNPNEVLKPFKDVRSLELVLPRSSGEIDSNLLRWKAEFGSQLQSCLFLGGTEIMKIDESSELCSCGDDSLTRIGDEELKLRIVWTISCLIAASTRHNLFQRTLMEHQTLHNLIIRDESNQGTFRMNREQIKEFVKCMDHSGSGEVVDKETLMERTKLPPLRMKMWYVPDLTLPASGFVMKGATLAVIKPIKEGNKEVERGADWVVNAFDGEGEEEKVFGEAVRKLLKMKRSYTLEMNSF
ncbi:F-box protein At5g46170-like [Coffea eugenioides]|uniref:F-box protein At4g18380-like n=1 Tax=Coffea arabica TaxID=13443 RepID=A0A6P6TN33_COFAR|nr:F-box protein At5g46170-like [Coffea arabica]XP_027183980.1 F-box protein At5g46170-like [Coffea eugenioides]